MVYKNHINSKANNRGITLIALVVTIVILLILAGISISIVLGEGGIIDSARRAGELTNAAIANEQQMLQNVVNWTNDYLSGNGGDTNTEKDPPPPTTEEPTLESLVGQKAKDENTVLKDESGKPQIVIPGKYKIVGPEQDETIDYGDDNLPQIEEGVVIQDEAYNQFVWVPVADVTKMVICQTHGTTISYDKDTGKFTCSQCSGKTLPAEDENNKLLLAGKLYATSTENYFDAGTTGQKYTANSGLREPDVLTSTDFGDASTAEDKGIAKMKEAGVLEESNDYTTWNNVESKWKEQLQDEFDRMIASVGEYGGFYIGRYETGNLQASEAKPIVQKNQTDNISDVNWYWMYKNSKKIATGEKVESSMIWGSQWDAVMNWFLSFGGETAGYVTNSDGKGNYSGSKKATGSDPAYRVKNIYDMAGNVYEWTLEANNTDYRVFRGGYYGPSGSDSPASSRYNGDPFLSNDNRGTRVTLLCNPES